jgi:hypothetical protein
MINPPSSAGLLQTHAIETSEVMIVRDDHTTMLDGERCEVGIVHQVSAHANRA